MYKDYKFHPLEREYEGWIIREIEDYFSAIDVTAMTHAVGYEKQFPADEFIKANEKIFALQFKRPNYENGVMSWKLKTKSNQYARVFDEPAIYYALPCFINREMSRISLNHVLFWRPEFSDGELIFEKRTSDGINVDYLFKLDVSLKAKEEPSDTFAKWEANMISSFLIQEKEAGYETSAIGKGRHKTSVATYDNMRNHNHTRAVRWGRFSEEIFDCNFGILKSDKAALNRVQTIVEALRFVEENEQVVSVIIGLNGKNGKIVFPRPTKKQVEGRKGGKPPL